MKKHNEIWKNGQDKTSKANTAFLSKRMLTAETAVDNWSKRRNINCSGRVQGKPAANSENATGILNLYINLYQNVFFPIVLSFNTNISSYVTR